MKIAIIGAGISGLTAAYRLGLDHDITLFESNDYLGGHTNTVEVELEGERLVIDTGFIVFNDWTYPNFIELLNKLGVRSQPTSMGFSVRCDATNLEYNGSSINGLFAQRRNLIRPSFYRMLGDIVRFNRDAPELVLSHPETDETTVGEFLAKQRYSREFAEHIYERRVREWCRTSEKSPIPRFDCARSRTGREFALDVTNQVAACWPWVPLFDLELRELSQIDLYGWSATA